ncbi:unnamed protein product [Cylindrotheca closterium]|uniref:TBC1 domain family member 23 n=1 Tax=Cylindrotheca closterium TaxID=2856 RepID=A0AAD2CBD5_9STRA|nr:unnamed protein product [Cylindrotheca closterium]
MMTADGDTDDEGVMTFDDEDDDELANLFSFGIEASESMASTEKENEEYKKLMQRVLPASVTDDDDSNYSDDSLIQLMEQNKDASAFDPLAVTEQSAEANKDENALTEEDDLEIVDMQEILDWLDNDEELLQAQHEDIVLVEPPEEEPLEQMLPKVANVPATPTFETLEQAVKSPKSTIAQIRDLVVKQGFVVDRSIRPHLWCKVICGKTLDETIKSSVADSFQQWEKQWLKRKEEIKKEQEEKETRQVEEKVAQEEQKINHVEENVREGKKAKEQDDSKPSAEEKELDGEEEDVQSQQQEPAQQPQEEPEQDWIEEVSDALADRIVSALHVDKKSSREALISILHNHYDDGAPTNKNQTTEQNKSEQKAKDDQNDETKNANGNSTENPNDSDEKMDDNNGKKGKNKVEIHDPLLPPVACAILSAGIPKVAASVMLSKIVPNFMPILGLTHKERMKAANGLHSQFHLLVCYHFPCLAIHLDRYIPDWYKGAPVGLVPQSWLVSHLAGECGGTFMSPRRLHCLWDLVLTSSNNSLRFFLSMALLQSHAERLVLLTGDELQVETKKVLSLDDNTTSDAQSEEILNQQAVQWVHDWSDKAQALWEATPLCIVRQLKRLEDDAVNNALLQRQHDIEKRLQARLDAEARAQQEIVEAEREKKADEARLRLTRARLVAYYRQYNPEKEGNIDKLMELYTGRYEVLDKKLKTKYGVGFNPPMKPTSPTKRSDNAGGGGGGGFGDLFGKKQDKDNDGDDSLQLRNLVMEVQVNEAVSGVCWSKSAHRSKVLNIKEASKLEHDRDGLLPLKFCVVDSRPKEVAESQGRFPTSINLGPETFLDPDSLAKQIEMLESLRGMAHLCIMGEGYSALPELYGHRMTKRLSACIGEDNARNRNCALFLLKRGLPFVSIVNGGFATMHAFLSREGPGINLEPQLVLADYNPELSVFGQFETVYSSSGRQKAQRKLQNLFDTSMAAMTLNTMRLEKAVSPEAANDSQTPNSEQNLVSRFFGRGEQPSTVEKGGSGPKPEAEKSNEAADSSKPLFGGFSVNFNELKGKKDEESLLSRNPFSMFGNSNDKKKQAEKGGMAGHFAGFKNKMEKMKEEVLNEGKQEKPKKPVQATVVAIPTAPKDTSKSGQS